MEREGLQRREHDRLDPSVMLPERTKRAPKRKNPEGPTTVTQPLSKRPTTLRRPVNKNSNSDATSLTEQEDHIILQQATGTDLPPEPVSTTPSQTSSSSTPATPAVSDVPQARPAEVINVDENEDNQDNLKHRLSMPGRPASSCVADHPHFRTKEALAYTFLVMSARSMTKSWKWSTKAKGSTGNFVTHFKHSHAKQSTLHSWGDKVFNVKKANRLLGEWVVLGCGAFTDVESPAFHRYVTHLRPGYGQKLIKGDAVKNHVSEAFKDAEKRLKDYLKTSPGKKAFAADAWTSNNNLAYLAIVVCFITENWEVASVLFDFPHLEGAHTGKNMTNLLLKWIVEFGLEDQFSALAADNAKVSTCNEDDIDPDNIEVPEEGFSEESAEEIVANDEHLTERSDEEVLMGQGNDGVDLKAVTQKRSEAFKKTISIVNAIADDPKFKLAILNLILDVVTRWNSTYYMLKHAKQLRLAIDELCICEELYKKYKISEAEWEVLDVILGFLEVFRNASEHMSAGSFPTLTQSLLNPNVQKGLEACKLQLEKYYDKSTMGSEYYYATAVLDPRIKHRLFDNNPDLFQASWHQQMENAFRARLSTYDTSASIHPPPPPPSQSVDDLYDDPSLLGIPTTSSSTATQTIDEEYASYLTERPIGENVLNFWKDKCRKFQRLVGYACDVLTIPGSSVCVERSLSIGKDLIGLHRHSLHAETMGELMIHCSILVFEGALREDYEPHSW
ncbi:hypothetical protein D9758_005231 [Tetrapyrgos nigripes]|uniref:HAT C-terminal dimerisation domain-containing protein n=1 Tax=Tetrapyrgos nigripes TaxID=182062 RepID=A0A8H5GWM7_9AGAR|nr:hypothetical protein D9758_005231 [Tetrapyrgos nigripes]